jgi:hypothetical protein
MDVSGIFEEDFPLTMPTKEKEQKVETKQPEVE